jgi:hypothetical protein
MNDIVKTAFVVNGCSWRGNLTKRNGKTVLCGHEHDSEEDARKCLLTMKTTRPGKCQDYRVAKIIWRIG